MFLYHRQFSGEKVYFVSQPVIDGHSCFELMGVCVETSCLPHDEEKQDNEENGEVTQFPSRRHLHKTFY